MSNIVLTECVSPGGHQMPALCSHDVTYIWGQVSLTEGKVESPGTRNNLGVEWSFIGGFS